MSEHWLDELARQADQLGQRKVARAIGYSASVVSQVLAGSYNGDVKAVQKAVEGAFLSAKVDCPGLGFEIRTDQCLHFQNQKMSQVTTPARATLWRSCKACPNNRKAAKKESSNAA